MTDHAQTMLEQAIKQYAHDLRRNSGGGDDYPWEIMKGVADLQKNAAHQPQGGDPSEAVIRECIEVIEKRFLAGWTITPNGLAREDEANEILEAIKELSTTPPAPAEPQGGEAREVLFRRIITKDRIWYEEVTTPPAPVRAAAEPGYFQPKVIGTKPCPYCLGSGKMTVIEFPASSNIFGPASANEGSAG